MILINVHCKVDPAKRDAFIDFANDLVAKSRQDAGNVFYSYFEDAQTPNDFLIVENWADQAAVDAHNQTAHLQNFLHHANDYLVEDYVIKVGHTD